MRGRILLFLSSLILPFSCVVDSAGGDAEDDADATSIVKVGDRIPAFSVEMVDNGQRSVFSSEQLSGPTMIVFFHTGCSDCQRELPLVEAWYQSQQVGADASQRQNQPEARLRLSESGFDYWTNCNVLAIAREESAETIKAFWQEHSLTLPYSPQSDRSIYNLFATKYIPRAYLCSSEGIVLWMGTETLGVPF